MNVVCELSEVWVGGGGGGGEPGEGLWLVAAAAPCDGGAGRRGGGGRRGSSSSCCSQPTGERREGHTAPGIRGRRGGTHSTRDQGQERGDKQHQEPGAGREAGEGDFIKGGLVRNRSEDRDRNEGG